MWQFIELIRGDTTLKCMKICLDRSRGASLDIHLFYSEQFGYMWNGRIEDILSTLLPHSSRWREFRWRTHSLEVHARFLMCLQGSREFPILESLVLRTGEEDVPDHPGDYEVPVLEAALFPQVRNVELLQLPLKWDQWPFANLTHLCLRELDESQFTLSQLAGLLSSSLSLVDLSLVGSAPSELDTSSPSPITLPSLRSFRLENLSEVSQALSVMRLVRAPNLQQLMVRRWYNDDYSDAISLIGSPSTGYPSIIHLNIGMIGLGSNIERQLVYEEIFRPPAGITKLTVYYLDDIGEILDPFPKSAERPVSETPISQYVLLPSLSSLRPIGIPYDTIHRVLSRRKEIEHPISRVVLRPDTAQDQTREITAFVDVIDYCEEFDNPGSEMEYDGEEWDDDGLNTLDDMFSEPGDFSYEADWE